VLRLRRYEQISVQNRRFRSNGGLLTQNFRQKGSYPTNHCCSQKTRLSALSYGIKMWTVFSSVLSQFTRLTDRQTNGRAERQTDRILIARPRLHSMQRGKNGEQNCFTIVGRSTVNHGLLYTSTSCATTRMSRVNYVAFIRPLSRM